MTIGASAERPRPDWRGALLVVLLAVVVAAPSLRNGFAYDDVFAIALDTRIHELSAWRSWVTGPYWTSSSDSLYRPLTTALFGLQWALGDGAPWLFHAVNLLLHAAVTAAVLWLASRLLAPWAALVAAAVFAVHPVHVEAVANVVGQSELLAGLMLVAGTALYLEARQRGPLERRHVLLLGLLYLLGILAKEHAFVLPALWLGCEGTVLRRTAPWRQVLRGVWPAYALAAALAAFALGMRWAVLGELGGTPVHRTLVGLDAVARNLVMLSVFPEILRVLVWPLRLHADYSPMHVVVSTTPSLVQLPGLLLVLATLVFLVWTWRQRPTAAFAVLLLLLPWLPTSNIAFGSGVLLAERALYTPSVGLVLGIGLIGEALRRHVPGSAAARVAGMLLLAVVLVAGTVRSMRRTPVWASSESVFRSLITEQPLSFKAHLAWGGYLAERGELDAAIREWRMAARIEPGYHLAYQMMGEYLMKAGRCDAAIAPLREAVRFGGEAPRPRAMLVLCLVETGQLDAAREAVRAAIDWRLDPFWFGAQRRRIDSLRTLGAGR